MQVAPNDDEPVPRLPRTRFFSWRSLSPAVLVRIALVAALLVMIVMTQRPCADAVSSFVVDFDNAGSAGSQMPKPGTVDQPRDIGSAGDYETIRTDMTEEEVKAVMERARAKEAARRAAAAGSAAAGSAASGSAAAGSAATGSAGAAGSQR